MCNQKAKPRLRLFFIEKELIPSLKNHKIPIILSIPPLLLHKLGQDNDALSVDFPFYLFRIIGY
jgi:hypothetical protein